MISEKIGQGAQVILRGIVRLLVRLRITPNVLTLVGFLVSLAVAFAFAKSEEGDFTTAGFILILAGLFDMVDGLVARATQKTSKFGAFFDSIMDRYSDLTLYLGLIIYYGRHDRMTYVVLVGIVMMASVLISYARARAECVIPECKVGFMERPERIVLLLIGSFWAMEPVLWVIAVIGNWTVVHRILYTKAQLTGRPQFLVERQSG
ncbi:MAG: CDP-alcohol phosphatidyltransferase family protein [Acidobacteriota bacterium]